MQEIPLTNDGKSRVTVNLGIDIGTYTFETYYNYTTQMWYLNLYDDLDEEVLLGIALVPNINLIEGLNGTHNIGQLFIVDTSPDLNGNTTTDSLGDTAVLIHFVPGEFEQLFPTEEPTLPTVNVDLKKVVDYYFKIQTVITGAKQTPDWRATTAVNPIELDITGAFSIVARVIVRTDEFTPPFARPIVGKALQGIQTDGYAMWMLLGTPSIRFGISPDYQVGWDVPRASLETPLFFCGTNNPTGRLKLYVNGEEVASGSGFTPISNTRALSILGTPDDVRSNPSSIYEVRIYSKELSAEEVLALYNGETITREGMAAYYAFTEGSGTTVQDLTGNGNDLTLTDEDMWGTFNINI